MRPGRGQIAVQRPDDADIVGVRGEGDCSFGRDVEAVPLKSERLEHGIGVCDLALSGQCEQSAIGRDDDAVVGARHDTPSMELPGEGLLPQEAAVTGVFQYDGHIVIQFAIVDMTDDDGVPLVIRRHRQPDVIPARTAVTDLRLAPRQRAGDLAVAVAPISVQYIAVIARLRGEDGAVAAAGRKARAGAPATCAARAGGILIVALRLRATAWSQRCACDNERESGTGDHLPPYRPPRQAATEEQRLIGASVLGR